MVYCKAASRVARCGVIRMMPVRSDVTVCKEAVHHRHEGRAAAEDCADEGMHVYDCHKMNSFQSQN